MKVDVQLVKHIAKLGNLVLTEAEIKLYGGQLQKILQYVETLNQVDTKNIKPTYQTLDNTVNVWREDKLQPERGLTQSQALSQANQVYQGFFVTDHVFSDKKQAGKTKKISRPKLDQYNAALTIANKDGNLGVKDLFCTQGIETTAGSDVLSGYKPQYSSTVINKLTEKGYKIKNKLNQDAWGHGSSGENSDFGPTKNPWDLSRVSGGSSSGSAVAVATGDVEIATGTDTCGSIRMPSNFTNVCGIKPTYGALSRYGVIAFASSLDCPGLFARSVAKLITVFGQVAGFDPYDSTSQSPARNKPVVEKAKIIGLPKEFFDQELNPEINQLIKAAAQLLEEKGYTVKIVSLPHSAYGIAAYYLIAPTETCSNLARFDGVRYGQDRSYFGPEAKRRIMLGSFAASAGYSAKYHEKAAKVRTLIVNDFDEVFKQVDVILAPAAPTPPFKLGEKTANPLEMYLADIYAAPASLAGLPSLALPCGFTKDKLPVGMQLIGPRWSESVLFTLGEEYQSNTNWHLQKPKL
ncbi:Asp-tRNA(Asn)/Glu-tRNA(Gln) amidotransferase subunit GatC [Patescibacteria group bacterium]|nr:Asp-tRNA(Asn)/Glu-tRNA(Gln) amidotransferase subunit GatC [Patescibacteria group bacterium]MBU1499906.1 Asp-tRNA(Asn)/Glu-tRNA(Gln) amidotransferase subunit GatC [Patescibacteria group bacterium]